MDVEDKQVKTSRRGRPPTDKKATSKEIQAASVNPALIDTSQLEKSIEEQQELTSVDVPSTSNGRLDPFAVLLSTLLKNNRSEVLRVARELGVSDNTVYRWMNGTSSPRANHLQHLIEVLWSPSSQLAHTGQNEQVHQSGIRGTHTLNNNGRWDVQKEFYRSVLEQAATTVDDASRRWHIIETIFEYALIHLDPDRQGMALTYAKVMPKHEDGFIHSLYEAEMRGQFPWSFGLDFKMYLGSNTLAGQAASYQRVRMWNKKDENESSRQLVGFDEHELSSCAAPVMRGGRLAGVIILSSAVDKFVNTPGIPRAVTDYANLLAAGLMDEDFHPISELRLAMMPGLPWQREQISRTYLNRVIECARKQCLSLPEAEQQILRTLEDEFEHEAAVLNERGLLFQPG